MDILILNIYKEYNFNNIVEDLNDLYMADNLNNSNTNSDAKTHINISNSAGDSAIIAASLAAGTQLAKSTYTL